MSFSKLQELTCILQCDESCSTADSIENITEEKWENIQKKLLEWKGLDKFGNVYEQINWSNGHKYLYMHKSCYTDLSNTRKLEQSKKRKLKLEEESKKDEISEPGCSAPKQTRSATGLLHALNKCVFCMGSKSKNKGRQKYIVNLLSTEEAWEKFKVCTQYMNDTAMCNRLSILISSIPDFKSAVASKIQYHKSCYLEHVTHPLQQSQSDTSLNHKQFSLQEAQGVFFEMVNQVIFQDHEFRSVQSLLRDYTRIINSYGYHSVVKSSYVKDILKREYGDKIAFYSREERNQSDIAYDNTAAGSYVEAAILSLGISNDQLLKNVVSRLHEDVLKTEPVKWPPLIPELEKPEEFNISLMKLITMLKAPNIKEVDDSPRVQVLASLLLNYITGSKTTFCINFTTWLHGLTKSREVVDVIHRDIGGISYNDVLMLRDFWAYNELTQSSNCPVELAEGEPAIMIVDNDNFRMDTLTGSAPQANRTNVMFVQPESLNKPVQAVEIPDKRASRLSLSLRLLNENLKGITPYKTTGQSEPPKRSKPQTEEQHETLTQRTRSVIHVLARANDDLKRPAVDQQKVPSYSGFQARMRQPVEKSTPLFHTSYPDNPNKSIINDCMDKLTKAVDEKKMPFAVIVGDYPVYKLMLDLKSENPSKYTKLIPFIDPFHCQMSFIYCMYKRFQGSGIDDVLVAAGVITEGSCEQALRGKHFNRGLRCLRLFYETLVHHALNHRLEGSALSSDVKESLQKLRNLTCPAEIKEAYDDLENNDEIKDIVETLLRDCSDSDHASLFVSFMEMVEILTQNIHSLRTQHWREFKSSLKLMKPWMISYGNDKYGRTLPDFCAVLESLPKEQEDFFARGMFAQSVTGNPYSCVALQIWIESTMNKGSKLKNGWKAILNNEKQVMSDVQNANNVNRIRGIILNQANQKTRKTKHADCSKSRIKKDEKAVQDMSDCLEEFGSDPFDVTNTQLRSLQSGIPASDELIKDFKSAKLDGEKWVAQFEERCVYTKEGSLSDRIPRSKRLNFANQKLQSDSGVQTKLKLCDMERYALAKVIDQVSGSFELQDILQHRVTDESMSIFNVNGSLRKCQKSKLLQTMTLSVKNEPEDYTAIIDMGFIWRSATPNTEDREKQDGSVYTWGDYAEKLVDLTTCRHKKAKRLICINDTYTAPYSIKDSERLLRKTSDPVKNEFMKPDKPFPPNNEFHKILSKPENKVRHQKFLEPFFKKKALAFDIEIVYIVVGEYSINLNTQTPEPSLFCLHAEADTALFTIYDSIRTSGYMKPVVMDTEDTDNYVQAAYVSHKLPGEMLIKKKKDYVQAKYLCTENEADVIIPLHIITGSDHTSGYYGIGKKAVADRVKQSSEAQNLLTSCGSSLELTKETRQNMTKFVIKYVYNDTVSSTPAEARVAKWKKQKKKSLCRMIPDEDSLAHHFKRVNYMSYIQKNFHLKEHPSPLLHGWHLEKGMCLPIRYSLIPLPLTMPLQQQEVNYDERESRSDSDDDNEDSCGSDGYITDKD